MAGEWGDFATASLTKFIAVRELGRLFSVRRKIPRLPLRDCSMREQLGAMVDPLQLAVEHGRVSGIAERIAKLVYRGRSSRVVPRPPWDEVPGEYLSAEQAIAESDVDRVASAPALASRTIASFADYAAIAVRRRKTFRALIEIFRRWPIGTPLTESVSEDSGPYAIPLLVNEPESIYPEMRSLGFPAYRWDRLWPGTPTIHGDTGASWRYQLLQIPVHQSYTDDDLDRLAGLCRRLSGGVKVVSP